MQMLNYHHSCVFYRQHNNEYLEHIKSSQSACNHERVQVKQRENRIKLKEISY
jgi:hypothetical protein